ncbi:hypothetical protein FH972_023123 [Carpinus fangiana]|uniref:chitinase n=1 Tax=Carpinus fangiana TaxID=176857 RepID=A0A5N6KUL5_9ROSI|nr:hypothetical protein FH972_023123 [Carpinus fangiana]
MRSGIAASAALLFCAPVFAQTFTKCNPLQQTCPADTALGKSITADFTSESSDFSGSGGGITYGADGASLTVASQGQAPTLESKWYLMFGKVEVSLKAAPGTGIVSSFVMQSDDLDEIDLEWLGGDAAQVQSNYFGKGITGGYDRGAFHPDPTSQSAFTTYTIDWTPDQVVWQINGQTVRVLTSAQAGNQFPQTPMQIKIGAWAGGDPSNAPGTISWAGGQTDYSAGPFTMVVKSVTATDYSTGTQYKYGDNSGSWQSIQAVGGSVNSGGSSSGVSTANVPAVSSTSGQPVPFEGTHAQPSSTYVTPGVYPWVGETSTATGAAASCYTGRPDGWTCSDTGKVLPPSSAVRSHPASTSSPSRASPSGAASSGADDRSTITGTPGPTNTKGAAVSTGPAPSTLQTTAPSSVIAAAPSAFTGAAMTMSADRMVAALGAVAGGLALFL